MIQYGEVPTVQYDMVLYGSVQNEYWLSMPCGLISSKPPVYQWSEYFKPLLHLESVTTWSLKLLIRTQLRAA